MTNPEKLMQHGAPISVTLSLQDLEDFGKEIVENALRRVMPTKDEKPYLTTAEVTALLDVDRTTLYRWTREKILTPVRMGHKLRYKVADIRKLMED